MVYISIIPERWKIIPQTQKALPIAVIGGGPVGLAAAVHLTQQGLPVKLYEAGASVATNVRDWGHVRVFTPWRYCVDPASIALLGQQGWILPPADAFPTGNELIRDYLEPLAAIPELASVIETNAEIVAISRLGMDKVVSRGRELQPFVLLLKTPRGLRRDLARAIVDASGTWATPNPLGANGLPAFGEEDFADRIAYGIPDVIGRDRNLYAGRTTLVVGAGHSAANALLDLARLGRRNRRPKQSGQRAIPTSRGSTAAAMPTNCPRAASWARIHGSWSKAAAFR